MPSGGHVATYLQSQAMLAGQPENPGAGHLFVARSDMEWFGRNPVGSIKTSVSPLCGDHDSRRARTGLRPSRFSPGLGQATDLAVAQAVVDEDEKFARAAATRPIWVPRRSPTLRWWRRMGVSVRWWATASTAAQRTRREPCLVMWPRRTVTSDSLCVGVRPAQLHRCRAEVNLEMSPISATNIAASTGPTPGMACTAW